MIKRVLAAAVGCCFLCSGCCKLFMICQETTVCLRYQISAIHPLFPQAKGVETNRFCAKSSFPSHDWKQIPNKKLNGWSLSELVTAHRYADSLHDASLMIVQCGRLIDERGDSSEKLTTFSIRKSLISALYGIYSAEGKININETLEQAGIDDYPSPLTKAERQARIVDLLRARSGVYHAADFETDFQRKIRPARGSHAPGTFWFYNKLGL